MRKFSLIFVVIISVMLSINVSAQKEDKTKPEAIKLDMPVVKNLEEEKPVAAIYLIPPYPHPLKPQVIVAYWPDGKVIWSDDTITGGPPYKTGTIDPLSLKAVLEDIKQKGVFDDPKLRMSEFLVIDSDWTTIAIAYEGKIIEMRSSHEPFEKNGDFVETETGAHALLGRSQEEVFSKASDEYKQFRLVWDEIKDALLAQIPTENVKSTEVEFTLGKLKVIKQ